MIGIVATWIDIRQSVSVAIGIFLFIVCAAILYVLFAIFKDVIYSLCEFIAKSYDKLCELGLLFEDIEEKIKSLGRIKKIAILLSLTLSSLVVMLLLAKITENEYFAIPFFMIFMVSLFLTIGFSASCAVDAIVYAIECFCKLLSKFRLLPIRKI